MKNKLLSAFLGGLLGILMGGYAYYFTGQHHFLLVPIGTFCGCFLGYAWRNLTKLANWPNWLIKKLSFTLPHINLPIKATYQKIKHLVLSINLKRLSILLTPFIMFGKWSARLIIRFNHWLKQHPMNFYLVQEIIVLAALSITTGYLMYQVGFLEFEGGGQKMSFSDSFKLLSLLSLAISTGVNSLKLSEKSLNEFYADFQFYTKWKTIGVIVKMTVQFFSLMVMAAIFVTGMITLIIYMFSYGLTLLVVSLILVAIVGLCKYIIQLIKGRQELSVLIITLTVTTICYFIYYNHMDNQVVIWLVAFLTGSLSALAVKMISALSGKTINRFYAFLTGETDPFDSTEYSQSWAGVLFFKPTAWIINLCSDITDKGITAFDIVKLKFR
jgi:hypothetical protein